MLHAAPLQRLGRYTGQRIDGPNSSWADPRPVCHDKTTLSISVLSNAATAE